MELTRRLVTVLALSLLGCSAETAGSNDDQSADGGRGGTSSSGGGSTMTPGSGGTSSGGSSANAGGAAGSAGSARGGAGGNAAGTGGDDGSGGAAGSGGSELPPLDGSLPPGENFDLSRWSITFPDATQEMEAWLAAGNEREPYFFTDPDSGGMVFRVPNIGETTTNSTYTRTELREMLRAGSTDIDTKGLNENNWVFSSSSTDSQSEAGGVDGVLHAALRVDHVSTSGDEDKVGRVIVGQIHASENEPCRLYYRKLPDNSRGSLYFAHEPNEGDEVFIELIGSREDDAADPEDGIALGEVFTYVIDAEGDALTLTITRPDRPDVTYTHDMSESAFADDWMYFKAGAYNQNNTGTDDDYAQVTFFALEATHD